MSEKKTTFGMRVSLEQKEALHQYQQQFENQSVFVEYLLSLLSKKESKQAVNEDNILKVQISPSQRGLIEYVANRESTSEVQVLPEHVLLYVFDEMLVKGNKFSIDSIPNSVINKLKERYSND